MPASICPFALIILYDVVAWLFLHRLHQDQFPLLFSQPHDGLHVYHAVVLMHAKHFGIQRAAQRLQFRHVYNIL